MGIRRFVGTALMLLVLAAPLSDPSLALAAESDPCALAQANADAGQLDAAIELYRVPFKAKESCAVAAFPAVLERREDARRLIEEAKTAQALGDDSLATEKTVEALGLDATNVEAGELLATLTGATGQFAAATALFEAGYHGAARALARQVATDTGAAIPPTLTRPDATARAADLTSTFDTWRDLIEAALPFVLLLAVGVLLALRYLRKPQVVIQSFECQETLCPGGVLAAVLISEISTIGSGRNLERVADTSTQETIKVEALVPDRAKWVAALLSHFGPRRQVRVSGLAFEANAHEVVISVAIVKPNGVVFDSRTFTNADADKTPAVLLRELVHDAAAWTLLRLNCLVGQPGTHYLGTDDWRSWGRFRRAVWRQTQDQDDARDAYLEAVEFDPQNWGAWLNLASLDTRARPLVSVIRLDTACALIKAAGSRELEPAYYRLLYLLGIAHLNCSVHADTPVSDRAGHALRAAEVGTELVQCSAKTTLRLADRRFVWRLAATSIHRVDRTDLQFTIALVQPTGIALLASAKVNAGQSVSVVLPGTSPLPTDTSKRAAQETLAELTDQARPDTLVDQFTVLFAAQQLPPGAHYNLACMYARALRPDGDHRTTLPAAKLIDAAFLHLIRAVESGDRDAMAATDPAFSELRRVAPARFRRITHRASVHTVASVGSSITTEPAPAPGTTALAGATVSSNGS